MVHTHIKLVETNFCLINAQEVQKAWMCTTGGTCRREHVMHSDLKFLQYCMYKLTRYIFTFILLDYKKKFWRKNLLILKNFCYLNEVYFYIWVYFVTDSCIKIKVFFSYENFTLLFFNYFLCYFELHCNLH